MKILTDDQPGEFPNGSVVTIGAYDGVHRGHRSLISQTVSAANEIGAESVVVTFDRHPASVVRPESAPLLLSDAEHKMSLLADTGVDAVCLVRFDEIRAKESAAEFVEEFLVDKLNVKLVVVGSDFHFGFRRQGDVKLLELLGVKHGFRVVGAQLERSELNTDEVISSTLIRKLVSSGEMELAARYLGRRFELRGKVEHGDSRGGVEVGFPTANVAVSNMMVTPPDGIYAGWIVLDDGTIYDSAISLGTRPTYYPSGGERLLEAYILGFDRSIYDSKLRVCFGKKIRDQQRFSNTSELKTKISEDVALVQQFCQVHSLQLD